MKVGFTQAEASALVNQLFETHVPLNRVPSRTRGRVIQAIDADDHWNVMIEWDLRGRLNQQWFTEFEINNYMRQV